VVEGIAAGKEGEGKAMTRLSESSPRYKSSIVIARLLASEGYTPKITKALRHYAKRHFPAATLRKYERVKRSLGEVTRNLSEGDRLVIGRFIAWQTRMAMDAGLRVGLAASLTTTEQDCEDRQS
jgi:hypothetical protein